jgi:hypothetical protein
MHLWFFRNLLEGAFVVGVGASQRDLFLGGLSCFGGFLLRRVGSKLGRTAYARLSPTG